jgi:cell division protein ZapB
MIRRFDGDLTTATDSEDNPKTMDELELKHLERRVDELLHRLSALKSENRSLRESQSALISERARLIEKTELARSRVEAMISRLRAMEQDS